MKSLMEYFNKQVKIIDEDGVEWVGFVETYTSSLDSEEEVEEIALKQESTQSLIGFTENEIKSIEFI